MALTDTAIRQSKPSDKPFKLYDRDGLFLQVNPGGSKLWRWRFKFAKKEKLMALGAYPLQTLADARALVLAGRKLLAAGTDPMAKRQEAKQAAAPDSFEEVAKQWWDWWGKGKAPRHADTVLRRLKGDVFPAYGRKPINAVTAADVREVMLAIDARGAHDLAKRARETTSQIFRYAIAHGLAERNPAMDFQPGDILAEVQVKHQPRVDARDLPELLASMDGYTGDTITRLAMRLMAYTFLRTSELIEAPWSEFDLDRARWDIPGPRMKMKLPHIVPLSRQSIEVLQELKALTGKGELVFPGANDKDKPMSNNTILFGLYRLGYRHQMTGHGFRGIASTVLHEHGKDHAHIELQLAHAEGSKVAAAYNFAQYLPQRAEMMQWWADYLDAQLEKGKQMASAA
jgi:integrase